MEAELRAIIVDLIASFDAYQKQHVKTLEIFEKLLTPKEKPEKTPHKPKGFNLDGTPRKSSSWNEFFTEMRDKHLTRPELMELYPGWKKINNIK